MLILHCENHGHPMLLSERRIRGIESGPDGMVEFANVPPAYFVMRQFSDYGAPVTETLGRSGSDGRPVVRETALRP